MRNVMFKIFVPKLIGQTEHGDPKLTPEHYLPEQPGILHMFVPSAGFAASAIIEDETGQVHVIDARQVRFVDTPHIKGIDIGKADKIDIVNK